MDWGLNPQFMATFAACSSGGLPVSMHRWRHVFPLGAHSLVRLMKAVSGTLHGRKEVDQAEETGSILRRATMTYKRLRGILTIWPSSGL